MTIGENIRMMRRRCGLTQEALAAKLSVTPQAVSKWENGGGLPDLMQIMPLAQIFGITTDSLLGVVPTVYGKAHTEAALAHEQLLMAADMSPAEKHLALYHYFRAESEKEPANYTLMRKCINHAAEISRYVDLEGFMSDSPEECDEIFTDCERKNACIARFCEDKSNVEQSDFAMAWIYIHTKQFDNAKKMIDRLPSLESNNLREGIETKRIRFQYGFDRAREAIAGNIRKLLHATAKEFFYGFEEYAWHAGGEEAIAYGEKLLAVLRSYRAFDTLQPDVLFCENLIRSFFPKCYADQGAYDRAAAELMQLAQNAVGIPHCVTDDWTNVPATFEAALARLTDVQREEIMRCDAYQKAAAIMERIQKDDSTI